MSQSQKKRSAELPLSPNKASKPVFAPDMSAMFRMFKEELTRQLSAFEGKLDLKLQALREEFVKMINIEISAVKKEIGAVKSDLSSIRAATDGSVKANAMPTARQQDRAGRNNHRIVGLKEGAEGDDPIGFLTKMLPQWLPSLARRNLEVMQAHCLPPNNSSPSDKPCTFIFNLLRYTDRQLILQAARKDPPPHFAEQSLRFYPDYSAVMARKRRAFSPSLSLLRSRGIQALILYPAICKFMHGSRIFLCHAPEEVQDFLESLNSTASPRGSPSRFSVLATEGMVG
ncbi:UNVERIFIED_CONTAM: hypothetical protein FKN15_046006 [Acipenser sinensis]